MQRVCQYGALAQKLSAVISKKQVRQCGLQFAAAIARALVTPITPGGSAASGFALCRAAPGGESAAAPDRWVSRQFTFRVASGPC